MPTNLRLAHEGGHDDAGSAATTSRQPEPSWTYIQSGQPLPALALFVVFLISLVLLLKLLKVRKDTFTLAVMAALFAAAMFGWAFAPVIAITAITIGLVVALTVVLGSLSFRR